jgi:hypothetical protein
VVLLDGSDDDVAEITEEWTVDAYEYGARCTRPRRAPSG